LWFVFSPFFSTIVYTFIFGRLANIGTDGIPHTLFYFSGTILWNFFSGCFNESCNVFITNAGIFGKVYFPRLVVPINYVLSNSIKTFIQFLMLIVLIIFYIVTGSNVHASWLMVFFPLIFIWLAAISVGAGIIISSLTTKYRDLRNIVGFALSLGMYATPVVYPISQIPARFQWISYINPISAPIELFREWLFGVSSVNTKMIFFSLGFTAILVFIGLVLFNQNEQNFIDVI
jgi:lipopolysaccharide transport system permease protein